MMEKDNKGFSLIEVIVVMAIMAVLVGIGAQIFGLAENGYVKKASSDLKTLIDQAEYNTQAVSAKEWKIVITKEDDTYVAKLIKVVADSSDATKTVETEEDVKYLSGGKKLQILFDATLGDGMSVSEQEITETMPLTISFEKQTGEVNKVTLGTTTYDSSKLKASTSQGVGNITISTTSSKVHDKTINIYWSTGKIFMK
jgi:prepilin-type N-terminal cleavage/methylation domain-containing protein